MTLDLKKILSLLLLCWTLALSSCLESKEEESSLPSSDTGAPAPTHEYDYVTLSYPSVSGTYQRFSTFAESIPASNITSMTLLTNFTSTPDLPSGINIDPTTGTISGTAYGIWTEQTYEISAQKPNNEGAVKAYITFSVSSNGVDPVDTVTDHYNFKFPQRELTLIVGVPMTPIVPTYQGPQDNTFFNTDGGNSPGFGEIGLGYDYFTGTISGTPTNPIVKRIFTVTMTDGNAAQVTITVIEGAPQNLSYTNENAIYPVGTAITTNTPTTSGGGNVASYSISPSLPAGLSFNTSTGAITGTPITITAQAFYTITATNVAGSTTKQIRITVPDAAPANLSYVTLTARYTVGADITANSPIVTGGGTATQFSVSPSLPSGLNLNTSTGVITGTPTQATAATSYTVTASNNVGSATKDISIIVVNPGSHTLYSTNGSEIKAYSVDEVTGEPIYVGKTMASPVNSKLIIHPSLDCAFGYSGNNVYAYAINKSQQGTLTEINSAGSLSGPLNMVLLSSGLYLYVVNDSNPSVQFVSRFSVDPVNCTVALLGTTSIFESTIIFSKDIAAAGNNIYTFDTTAKIRHLSVNTSNGDLTLQSTLSMSTHANPPAINPSLGSGLALRAHAAGTYIYASDSLKAVQPFAVDNSTGALTPLTTLVDNGTILMAPPVIDPINHYYISGYRNGSNQGGLTNIILNANGSIGTVGKIEGSSVATGFTSISTVGIHTSQSGTYLYSTYSPVNNPTTAVRVKIESNGSLTPKGLGIVGHISGY